MYRPGVKDAPSNRMSEAILSPDLVGRRPEINVRHTAFRRGSAYLERYCMLITFAVYLEALRDRNQVKGILTFEEWMAGRPEIIAARDALHQNPAGALAPVPPANMPHMWLTTERHNSSEVWSGFYCLRCT